MRASFMALAFVVFLALVPAPVFGQAEPAAEPGLPQQVAELKQMILQMQADHEREIGELRARMERAERAAGTPLRPGTGGGAKTAEQARLEAELAAELGTAGVGSAAAGGQAPAPTSYAEFSLIGTFMSGYTSLRDRDNQLEHGGGHVVQGRGFNANLELAGSGAVDPYFTANANVIWQIDEDGETIVEFEEGFMTSTCLPAGLQFKGGNFYSPFGRANRLHLHSWEFADIPVAVRRMFGTDQMRSPGVQMSWLTPLPFFAEVTVSAQNASGETVPSFIGTPEETNDEGGFAGRPLADRDIRSAGDLLYVTRLETSFDLTDEFTVLAGLSAAFGPNSSGGETNDGGLDSTGLHHRTQIYGADLFLKWKPLSTQRGWPFVSWQTEYFYRNYEAAPVIIDADLDGLNDTIAVDGTELWDQGLYSQIIWGFTPGWTLGVRYDYAVGEDDRFDLEETFGDVDGDGEVDFDRAYDSRRDAFRDERHRASGNVTFYPSEFSKFRLEYHYDNAEHLEGIGDDDDDDDSEHSGFFIFEYSLGKHGAHKF